MRQRTPLNALQKAVYDRLTADLGSMAIVHSWFAPPTQAYPYVVIEEYQGSPEGTKTSMSEESTLTVRLWSDELSTIDFNTIFDAVLQSLSRGPLELEDGFVESRGFADCVGKGVVPVWDAEFQKVVLQGTISFMWRIEDTRAA